MLFNRSEPKWQLLTRIDISLIWLFGFIVGFDVPLLVGRIVQWLYP